MPALLELAIIYLSGLLGGLLLGALITLGLSHIRRRRRQWWIYRRIEELEEDERFERDLDRWILEIESGAATEPNL